MSRRTFWDVQRGASERWLPNSAEFARFLGEGFFIMAGWMLFVGSVALLLGSIEP